VLALTTHASPAVRVRALKEMCPCRVKGDIARFWDRVLEMTDDADAGGCTAPHLQSKLVASRSMQSLSTHVCVSLRVGRCEV
jgi:hypothetical protein